MKRRLSKWNVYLQTLNVIKRKRYFKHKSLPFCTYKVVDTQKRTGLSSPNIDFFQLSRSKSLTNHSQGTLTTGTRFEKRWLFICLSKNCCWTCMINYEQHVLPLFHGKTSSFVLFLSSFYFTVSFKVPFQPFCGKFVFRLYFALFNSFNAQSVEFRRNLLSEFTLRISKIAVAVFFRYAHGLKTVFPEECVRY